MTFLLQLFNGGDSKKKGKPGSIVKPRSLRMEPLENRELLSVTGWETGFYPLSNNVTETETVFVANETEMRSLVQVNATTPSEIKLEATETSRGLELSWTAFPSDFTYSLYRNGKRVYNGTATFFEDTDGIANTSYIVYAENATGERYASTALEHGAMFDPELRLAPQSDGSVKLNWDNQKLSDPTGSYGYMLTRNGQTITPMLGTTSFHDKDAPSDGVNAYVLYVYCYDTQNWSHSEAQPVGTFAAPSDLYADEIGENEFTLNWTAPAETTGAVGYQVELWKDGKLEQPAVIVDIGTDFYTFTGLDENTSYECRVTVIADSNYAVKDSATVTLNVTTESSLPAPDHFQATSVSTSSIMLGWTVPGDTSEIKEYVVEWSDGTNRGSATITDTGRTYYEITGLPAFTSYTVRIYSVATDGVKKSSVREITQSTVLLAPVLTQASAIWTDQVELKWSEPVPPPTGTGAGYKIEWSYTGGMTWNTIGSVTVGEGITEYVVPRLTPGATYYFRVTAVGPTDSALPLDSVPSSNMNETMPTAMLGVPRNFTAAPGANEVVFNWVIPADNTSGVTGYIIECLDENGVWKTVAEPLGLMTTTATVPMIPGSYDFRISSTGAAGSRAMGYAYASGIVIKASAPTNLTASDIDDTGLLLSWTPPSVRDGIAGYRIDYAENGVWSETPFWADGRDTSTMDLSGLLKPNTSYVFRIYSADAKGEWISDYDETGARTLLTAPTITNAASTNYDSIDLTWIANGNLGVVYEVQYLDLDGSWKTFVDRFAGTSTSVTGLLANKDYTFRVRAVSTDGYYSAFSDEVTATTLQQPLDAPILAASTVKANSVDLTWNAVTGAGSYTVYYRLAGTTDWQPAYANTTNTTETVRRLSAATPYEFMVEAHPASSDWADTESNIVTETTRLLTPTGLQAKATGVTTADLSWTWGGDADTLAGFTILCSTNGGTFLEIATGITDNTYKATGLTANTPYRFQVIAVGKNGLPNSEASASSNAIMTELVAPIDFEAVALDAQPGDTETSVKLTWDMPTGVVLGTDYHAFILEWKLVSVDDWNPNDSYRTTQFEHTVKGLDREANYEFRLRAVTNEPNDWRAIINESDYAEDQLITALPQLKTPTDVIVADYGEDFITVTWTKVENATGYSVEITATGYTDTQYIYTGTTAEFENLPSGTAYTISVTALADTYNDKFKSSDPFRISAATRVVATGDLIATAHDDERVDLAWSVGNTTGLSKFVVSYKKSGALDWERQFDVPLGKTDWSVTGLDANATYIFEVEAIGLSGIPNGVPVATATATTKLGNPDNLRLDGSPIGDSIDLRWDAARGATGYYYEWIFADQDWDNIYVDTHRTRVDTNSCTVNLPDVGTAYQFRVWAAADSGASEVISEGYASGEFSTNIAEPVLSIVSVSDQEIVVGWSMTSTAGVRGYEVECWDDQGVTVEKITINDPTQTGCTFSTGLRADSQYTIRVTAIGDNNERVESKVESVSTLWATVEDFTNIETTSGYVRFSWTRAVGADGYLIYYSSTANPDIVFPPVAASNDGADPTLYKKIDGLDANTEYSFYIVSVKNNVASVRSTPSVVVMTAKAALDAPVGFAPAWLSRTATSLTVQWYAPTAAGIYTPDTAKYATGAVVQYSADGGATWNENPVIVENGDIWSCDLDGLDPGTTYTFRVCFTGDDAIDNPLAWSAEVAATLLTEAPENARATSKGADEILLEWDAPAKDHGIKGYLVKVYNAAGAEVYAEAVDETTTQLRLDENNAGLLLNTAYTFKIWSYNSQFDPTKLNDLQNLQELSAIPAEVDTLTGLAGVRNLKVERVPEGLHVTWLVPQSQDPVNNQQRVDNYLITWGDNFGYQEVSGEVYEFVIPNSELTAGGAYVITVTAKNNDGQYSKSERFAYYENVAMVTGITEVVSWPDTLQVKWNIADTDTTGIRRFEVVCRETNDPDTFHRTWVDLDQMGHGATFTGLKADTPYYFEIISHGDNTDNKSDKFVSDKDAYRTEKQPLTAPKSLRTDENVNTANTLFIAWDGVPADEAAFIQGYEISWWDGEKWGRDTVDAGNGVGEIDPTNPYYEITGLLASNEYDIIVTAIAKDNTSYADSETAKLDNVWTKDFTITAVAQSSWVSAKIDWADQVGATDYRMEYAQLDDTGKLVWKTIATTNGASEFTFSARSSDTNPKSRLVYAGQPLWVRVYAIDSEGNDILTSSTKCELKNVDLAKPTNLTFNQPNLLSINLRSWDIDYVTHYKIVYELIALQGTWNEITVSVPVDQIGTRPHTLNLTGLLGPESYNIRVYTISNLTGTEIISKEYTDASITIT